MAEEKKKGFWSWLGLGKKEESEQLQTTQESNEIEPEVEIVEQQAVDSAQNFAEQEPAPETEDIAENHTKESACEAESSYEQYEEPAAEPESNPEKPASEGGFFSRLIKGLVKTKQSIGSGFRNFFSGKKIDDELFEELEEQLLVADLGMPTTTKIIKNLTEHATKQQLRDAELLYQQLKIEL